MGSSVFSGGGLDHICVEILMATYNGERFLEKQIESIQSQQHTNWKLSISDDCSTDRTVEMLRKFKSEDQRIRIVSSGVKHGGAKQNFFHLINNSEADYIMLSDQDDYWLPNKISLSLEKILELEDAHGKESAALVSTDAAIVDEKLATIAPSFLDSEHFPHSHGGLAHCLVENNVWGCLTMFNKALSSIIKCTKAHDDILMHDWWLLLVAKTFGNTALIDTPTVMYRQHADNVVGTAKFSVMNLIRSFDLKHSQDYWLMTQRQARSIIQNYGSSIPKERAAIINSYLSLFSKNRFSRLHLAYKNGNLPTGVARRAGQAGVFLLSGKKISATHQE